MDAKELRELIEIISRSSFSIFELEREGFKLRLVKNGANVIPSMTVGEPLAVVPATPAPPAVVAAPTPETEEAGGLVEVPSPIVGTFYRQPSPGADPFVEVGAKVRKGQVLCIIEAMKLMNEIEAEIDAEVAEVCVQNGQPVEYGEVLFRLRPLS